MFARIGASLCLSFLMSTTTLAGAPATTGGPRQLRNIEYSRPGGNSLLLDASLPGETAPAPAVIIVHGGGWVRGGRRIDVQPLFEPLTQAGFAWFSIDYRLASDITQFGVAVEDVSQAVRFVRSHAAEYNIDPARIGLVGESAGGQLAAMAALRANGDDSVKAFVGIYTPTNLVSLFQNSTYLPSQIRDQVRGTPFEGLVLAALRQLSPVDNVRRDMPPFLLIHGTADPLVPFRQSTEMCSRMRQVGASCEVYPVEGAGHGIRWWASSSRASEEYKQKMVEWLRSQLGGTELSRGVAHKNSSARNSS